MEKILITAKQKIKNEYRKFPIHSTNLPKLNNKKNNNDLKKTLILKALLYLDFIYKFRQRVKIKLDFRKPIDFEIIVDNFKIFDTEKLNFEIRNKIIINKNTNLKELYRLLIEKNNDKPFENTTKKIPDIPLKYKKQSIFYIDTKNDKELFYFLVRKMFFSDKAHKYLTHNQIGNLIFDDYNSQYLKRVVNKYNNYFEYSNSLKKRLNFYKIYQEHPAIWDENNVTKILEDDFEQKKQEILKAIDDEIIETKKQEKSNYIQINEIQIILKKNNFFIYKANVLNEKDEFLNLPEGIQVDFLTNRKKISITILEFNIKNETISFSSSSKIVNDNGKIIQSTIWLLKKTKTIINDLIPNDKPIWKLFNNHIFPNKIIINKKNNLYLSNLDKTLV